MTPHTSPHFWLLKTEPNCWSWAQQTAATTTGWDDVRNFQAQKYLKAMHKGDQAFFYHTGNERRIVGIVEITREAYPDSSDPSGRFIMVDVKTLQPFLHPVSLSQMKAESQLAHLPLITQGRLSVMPIDQESWQLLCQWGGI